MTDMSDQSVDVSSPQKNRGLFGPPGVVLGSLALLISVVALIVAVQGGSIEANGESNPISAPTASSMSGGDVDVFGPPEELEELIDQVRASTVTIRCKGIQGSGWVIDLGSPTEDADDEAMEIDRRYPTEVITNNHVIEKCHDTPGKVKALAGDVEFDAYLYSWDEEHDLALVAISQDVPPLTLSPKPQPGWWAMAVGTPYGLEGSVSIGNVMNTEAIGDVVSTTPLNSGNSGGPLVNSRGEVIGTTTEVYVGDDAQDWNIARGIPLLCSALVLCEEANEFNWDDAE